MASAADYNSDLDAYLERRSQASQPSSPDVAPTQGGSGSYYNSQLDDYLTSRQQNPDPRNPDEGTGGMLGKIAQPFLKASQDIQTSPLAGLGNLIGNTVNSAADAIGVTSPRKWFDQFAASHGFSPPDAEPPKDPWSASIDDTGITGPQYRASSGPGKAAQDFTEGALAALPSVPFGVAPATAAVAGGMGLATKSGLDYINPGHDVLNSWLSMIPGLAAGTAASKTENAIHNPGPVAQAYRDSNITPFVRAGDAANDQFGASVENAAGNLGDSSTLQEAGSKLQGSARDWIDQFKTDNKSKWDAADSHFSPGERVPIANYVDALGAADEQLSGAPAQAKILRAPLAGRLTGAVQEDTGSGSLQDATLPYSAVKGLRSYIGERLGDPNLPTDLDTGTLNRLYGSLSEDLKSASADKGTDAIADFVTANDATRNGHQFIDTILKPIIKDGVTPEQAASKVLSSASKGGTALQAIRDQLPDAADELAAFKLRDMARKPTSFNESLRKVSPEATAALFPGPVADQVKSLGTVSNQMAADAASNAGQITHIGGGLLSPLGIIEGASKGFEQHGLTGALTGGFIGGAAIPSAAWVGHRILTNPLVRQFRAAPTTPLGLLDRQ